MKLTIGNVAQLLFINCVLIYWVNLVLFYQFFGSACNLYKRTKYGKVFDKLYNIVFFEAKYTWMILDEVTSRQSNSLDYVSEENRRNKH